MDMATRSTSVGRSSRKKRRKDPGSSKSLAPYVSRAGVASGRPRPRNPVGKTRARSPLPSRGAGCAARGRTRGSPSVGPSRAPAPEVMGRNHATRRARSSSGPRPYIAGAAAGVKPRGHASVDGPGGAVRRFPHGAPEHGSTPALRPGPAAIPVPIRLEREAYVARHPLTERRVCGQRARVEEEPVAPHEPPVHVSGERHLRRPGDAVLVFLDHERLVELQLEVQLDVQEDVERLRARARVIRAAHTDARVARPIRVLLPERPMRGRAVVGPVAFLLQIPVSYRLTVA